MNTSDKHLLLVQAVEIIGRERQFAKAIEEMSELIIELSRLNTDRCSRPKILEELVHSQLMLQQIIIACNFTEEELRNMEEASLNRLEYLLKSYKKEEQIWK